MSDFESHFFLQIPPEMAGVRLDKALAELLTAHSRGAIQQWIKQGSVLVNGEIAKQKLKLGGTEHVEISVPDSAPGNFTAQEIHIEIVYEDDHIMVINKPAGLVVHPGAGNHDGTLLNGLLFHNSDLSVLPRAGIVHRLDKDTTGLMVIAKTEQSRQHLIEQLSSREMHREYLALVNGIMISGEIIDQPIARHRRDRLRMAVTPSGKPAITRTRVLDKYRSHSLVQANLETGRTHQIRVHLSWRGYPIVGDTLYGNRYRPPPRASVELVASLQGFQRQALHAHKLSLIHPDSGEEKTWQQPVPEDMNDLIRLLRQDAEINSGSKQP
jgi:23S rRNA pseudouridine1911/1915/1917 synthase